MDDNVSVWDANNDELRLLFLCHDVSITAGFLDVPRSKTSKFKLKEKIIPDFLKFIL